MLIFIYTNKHKRIKGRHFLFRFLMLSHARTETDRSRQGVQQNILFTSK